MLRSWEPVDIFIGIFTITVSIGLLFIIIVSRVIELKDSIEYMEAMAALVATMLSIVSMYVGAKLQKKGEDK